MGPECIAKAIERAIESRRPAARYVAPFRARLMLALTALLPTRWLDAIIRAGAGISRKRLLGAATTHRPDPAPRALAS